MLTKKCSGGEYWKWKPVGEESLDQTITLRLTKKQKTKLKDVSQWQEQLRSYIDELIESDGE